ncbi:MAG: nitroreductase family protein [bacterium]|nr:nitroreductase family protein [bacterium]
MKSVKESIEKRRAFRSLDPLKIETKMIKELAYSAILAPSCFNKQPEKFIFVKTKKNLEKVFSALPEGNKWVTKASMVAIVHTKKDDDCIIKEREYYLFDTGMSVGFLILRATEMGIVAHPIAGYDPEKIKDYFALPKEENVIALIIFGKHSKKANSLLSDWQKEQEIKRPKRKTFKEFAKIV